MSSLFCLPTVIFAIALPFCCLRTVLTPLVRSARSCPWQHPPAGTSSFAFVDPLRPRPGRGVLAGSRFYHGGGSAEGAPCDVVGPQAAVRGPGRADRGGPGGAQPGAGGA